MWVDELLCAAIDTDGYRAHIYMWVCVGDVCPERKGKKGF